MTLLRTGTTSLVSCGANGSTLWCNKAYDALTQQARATLDVTQRKALYAQAQRMVAEQVPLSVIAYGELVVPTRRNVIDFRLDAEGNMRFDGVTLK